MTIATYQVLRATVWLASNTLDIEKTNVPNIRLAYRYQTLMEERFMVYGGGRGPSVDVSAYEGDKMQDSFHSATNAAADIGLQPVIPAEPMLAGTSPPAAFQGSPRLSGMQRRASFADAPALNLVGPMLSMSLSHSREEHDVDAE